MDAEHKRKSLGNLGAHMNDEQFHQAVRFITDMIDGPQNADEPPAKQKRKPPATEEYEGF